MLRRNLKKITKAINRDHLRIDEMPQMILRDKTPSSTTLQQKVPSAFRRLKPLLHPFFVPLGIQQIDL